MEFLGPQNGPSNAILNSVLKFNILTEVFGAVKKKFFELNLSRIEINF